MCVDIFYEISAQLRHLVWCTLLLVYVVWAARAQCPVSAHHPRHPGEEREERENIKFVCVQWPVTRCAKLRLITINNNQLNVTISITVIINSWWDCFWLGKHVILSLSILWVDSWVEICCSLTMLDSMDLNYCRIHSPLTSFVRKAKRKSQIVELVLEDNLNSMLQHW